jgi:hypothetical protein
MAIAFAVVMPRMTMVWTGFAEDWYDFMFPNAQNIYNAMDTRSCQVLKLFWSGARDSD